MSNNYILDYEDVIEKINGIVSRGLIKREEPLGYTEHGLPIDYLTVGNGDKDIVITGATHGSEIITTDFVLKLMVDIDKEDPAWAHILDEFKIHFIPMLNPEGYLITTSAIRKLIPKDMNISDAEKICKDYYLAMREDNNNPLEYKRYQKMFEDVDYTAIPDTYKEIKDSVKKIYEKYPDLPKGSMIIWSANGNGIDIQANNVHNPAVQRILDGEEFYMKSTRYNNIMESHPGPINCPFDKEKGFKTENETKIINALLEKLNKDDRLFMYLNYHSSGGLIYQRPANAPENMDVDKKEMDLRERMNYMMAKAYSSKTYKNAGNYNIMKGKDDASSSNDIFRIKYPVDILIELSPMGGNPIAPYGDIEGNYNKVISSNIDATKHTLYLGTVLKSIIEEFSNKVESLDEEPSYESTVDVEDMIYDEFKRRIGRMM